MADEVVSLETPNRFLAIGQWYGDFTQTSDEEVVTLLRRAAENASTAASTSTPTTADTAATEEEVEVIVGPVRLAGQLSAPQAAAGLVVFAHGSGSSRKNRNRFFGRCPWPGRVGTLLFDLLTGEEEADRSAVFDTDLLAGRWPPPPAGYGRGLPPGDCHRVLWRQHGSGRRAVRSGRTGQRYQRGRVARGPS